MTNSHPSNVNACIRDIFIQERNSEELDEYLRVHGGVTFIRNRALTFFGDRKGFGGGGRRGPVTEFSNKSRRNMMVTMAKMKEPFEFWQDLTLADDIMAGLSINERAKYVARCLWSLKQWATRAGIKINGVWKKEWQKRKSGALVGQYIPHFHIVYSMLGADHKAYESIFRRVAAAWVEISGTKETAKALAVAIHPKSYRFIRSRKQMQVYMSKYFVKKEGFVTNESIGRNWGFIGDPCIDEGEFVEMTWRDMVLFKRCLRKLMRRTRKHFAFILRRQYSRFFVFLEKHTIDRILQYIQMPYRVEGVPF